MVLYSGYWFDWSITSWCYWSSVCLSFDHILEALRQKTWHFSIPERFSTQTRLWSISVDNLQIKIILWKEVLPWKYTHLKAPRSSGPRPATAPQPGGPAARRLGGSVDGGPVAQSWFSKVFCPAVLSVWKWLTSFDNETPLSVSVKRTENKNVVIWTTCNKQKQGFKLLKW